MTAHWKAIVSAKTGQTVAQCQDCYRNAPAARMKDGEECSSGECVSARRTARRAAGTAGAYWRHRRCLEHYSNYRKIQLMSIIAVITYGDPDMDVTVAIRDDIVEHLTATGADVMTLFAGTGEWYDVDEHSEALLVSHPGGRIFLDGLRAALRHATVKHNQDAIGYISPGSDRTLLSSSSVLPEAFRELG
jgi:hypothetical protein